jgi:hypothetical protein
MLTRPSGTGIGSAGGHPDRRVGGSKRGDGSSSHSPEESPTNCARALGYDPGVDELTATTLAAEMGANYGSVSQRRPRGKMGGGSVLGARKARGSVSPGRPPKAAFGHDELSAKRPGLPRAPKTHI